jgi:hypothetical protein
LLCCIRLIKKSSGFDTTLASRPPRHIAPTTKLTDANNAARPELAFQRKAVQAFHTQRAEELENTSVANSGQDPSVVAAGSTLSPPEHNNIVAITNSVDPSEDEDIDDHPKPCNFFSLSFRSLIKF